MAKQDSVACIHHVLFIHSCVDGHLGCFYIWAVVNDAVIVLLYRYLCEFLLFWFFWVYIPKRRIGGAGQLLILHLTFSTPPHSQWWHHFTFPTANSSILSVASCWTPHPSTQMCAGRYSSWHSRWRTVGTELFEFQSMSRNQASRL